MDGINRLLNLHEKDVDGLGNAENNVKGIFLDLLSCLGGDKHPMLPQGYKQKPMKGFLNILEAFNEMAKLQNTGSGIVCEVDSKEFVQKGNVVSGTDQKGNLVSGTDRKGNLVSGTDQNGNLVSGIDQTLESKMSKESTFTNTDSEIDVQEFLDAEDDHCKKEKKKQQSKTGKAALSSSDEHLWTSASGSEYEDAN